MPRKTFPTKSAVIAFLFLLLVSARPTASAESAERTPAIRVIAPLKFTMTEGAEATRSHVIALRNPTKTALDWSISTNQSWLKPLPAIGSSGRNEETTIDFVVDAQGFSPGVYEAGVKIATPNAVLQTLTVTMTVQSAFARVPITNAERTFPPDSGMANVKTDFGAKGDGVTDDTAAIQKAISSTVHHSGVGARIIYFPAGTYLVSQPILEKDSQGRWSSLLTLQGENRATTVIKLSDNNQLYQNNKAPADVITLASQHGSVTGGGNEAFDNHIFDLTIDVGSRNPGATALSFMGNNYCGMRNVTLRSSDPNHAGAIGLNLQRYAAGPCLMKNIVVDGFDYGIKVAANEYSLVFENLYLLNQTEYAIFNASNVLSIRHLLSTNSVPAICNRNASGLITLLDASLLGGSSRYSAIQNAGTLYARNVNSSGYASALEGTPGSSISEYDSGPVFTQFGSKGLSLNLPIEETPEFEDTNLANWKSVTAYGADPTGKTDSAAAIQTAIDSGATTIYFPTGVYLVSRTIQIRGAVHMMEGFGSSLNPSGRMFQDLNTPAPLLQVQAGTAEVVVDHLRIAAFSAGISPGIIGIQQNSARPFVLRDSIIGQPPSAIAYENTAQGTGTLFVENVAARPWEILFPQKVFARQINPEGNMTKITNRGGKLWILGLKTEGTGTNVETDQGGTTELLGGLIYPVWRIPPDTSGFVINDSQASLMYAVSSYKPAEAGTDFVTQVQESQHGVTKSLASTSLPPRGLGIMMPLYRSADRNAQSLSGK